MNKIKKMIITAVCIALCAVLATSCTMVSVNQDKDRAQVVAEVNGTAITKGEVLDQVDMMLQMYGMTRDAFVQQYGADEFTTMKENMLDSVVQSELLYQHAKADGLLNDSEENKAEKKSGIEDTLASMRTSIEEQVNADETVTDKEAAIEDQYNTMVEYYGYKDVDKAVENAIRAEAISAETDKLNGEVSYTEEDAKKEYDTQMETQKTTIENNPSAYTTYQSAGLVVFEPANSKYVKNLLIALPDDVQTEIKTKRQGGDDAGADELVKTELAKIKTQADEALARAKAGEDFNALIEELGGDPGMKSEPAKTEGYFVFAGSGMVEPFETASLALTTPGQISDLVPTDFGYHIIQYVSEGGGEVPFDDVKEEIIKDGLSTAQTNHMNETIEQWKGAEDIKTYADRLSTFA